MLNIRAMEEKDIKITINVGCLEKSRVKKEQIAGYLLRAIAGVTANNKCFVTNYVCEINEKNDDKLQDKYITGKPKLTKDEKTMIMYFRMLSEEDKALTLQEMIVDSYILPDELNRGTSSIYIWMTQQVRNLLLLNL